MSEIFALEQHLEALKHQVSLGDMAEKLSENPEFKKLIVNEFMLMESARYAHASCDPALDERGQKDALNIAQAGGHLKRWLSIQIRMANQARREIPETENNILELRQEGGE